MKYFRKIYLKIRNYISLYPADPYKIYNFLMTSQYWENDKLQNYQISRFNKLIKSAFKVPYYNSILFKNKSDLNIEEIRNLAVTEKEVFQQNPTTFSSGNLINGFTHASSGSTGKPTKITISKEAEAFRKASVIRFREWWNLKPEDKLINFTAYPRSSSSLIKRIKNYFNPKLDIDIFSINKENIYSLYERIKFYKPEYFRGYVSSIKQFGVLLLENELDARILNLKLIIVTSEILYESDRAILEEIFGCKVANEYGCAEGGLIAYECPKGGMHIQEEMILLFTNNKDEIISTELNNDLTPLINYKIGDKVILTNKKCGCGRNLKLIERIEGRIGSDDIIKPDGSRMNYLFFDKMIKNMSNTDLWGGIQRFQIIQKGIGFNIYLVKGDSYSNDVNSYFVNYIKKGISEDVNVKIFFVDDIKPEKSGKYRIFKRIESDD